MVLNESFLGTRLAYFIAENFSSNFSYHPRFTVKRLMLITVITAVQLKVISYVLIMSREGSGHVTC